MLKKLLCKIFNLVPKAQYDQLDKRFSESSSLMQRDLEKHSSNIEMLLSKKHLLEEMYSLLQKEYNDTLAKSSMEQGALNNKIGELLEEVQKHDEELRRRRLDIQALLEKNRIVEDNNASLLQAIEKVNIENSELKKCISYYILLIAAVNAKKNQEIQILKYENEKHNLQIEGFGVEKNRLASEIVQLNNNLGNAIAQNQEYKLQIKTLEQLHKDNKNLKDVLKVRESRLNELEEKLEGAKKDKEIIEQKNSEISQLRSDVYKYTRQLSIERGILSSAQEKFDLEKDELKNELAKKDLQNKELKETYQKYVNHLLEEKNILEVSESKLREEKNILEVSESKLREEKSLLQNQLEENLDKNIELNKEIIRIRNSVGTNNKISNISNNVSKKARAVTASNIRLFNSAPKNLKLTESVNILEVAKKSGQYIEVLHKDTRNDLIDPKIKYIIDKLSKIKLEVSYERGVFYFISKQRGKEKLVVQHFEEYNKVILLLYDGREYCGYDMESGKRVSERYKKKSYALAELDVYYENKYCR